MSDNEFGLTDFREIPRPRDPAGSTTEQRGSLRITRWADGNVSYEWPRGDKVTEVLLPPASEDA